MNRQSYGIISLVFGLIYFISTFALQNQYIEINFLMFGIISLNVIWSALSFICKINMAFGLKQPTINWLASILFLSHFIALLLGLLALAVTLDKVNLTMNFPINTQVASATITLWIMEIIIFLFWGIIDLVDLYWWQKIEP